MYFNFDLTYFAFNLEYLEMSLFLIYKKVKGSPLFLFYLLKRINILFFIIYGNL